MFKLATGTNYCVWDTSTVDRQGTSKLGFKQRKVEYQTLIAPVPTKRPKYLQYALQVTGIFKLHHQGPRNRYNRKKKSYLGDWASLTILRESMNTRTLFQENKSDGEQVGTQYYTDSCRRWLLKPHGMATTEHYSIG